MKVIFNCAYFAFHKDFCINIKNELENRGHIAIITESRDTCRMNAKAIENYYIQNHSDADFTVLPDEACRVIGGKGIFIFHALLPVTPQKAFYTSKDFRDAVNTKSDFLFISSDQVGEIYTNQLKIYKPIIVVGYPKLDNISKKKKNTEYTILYAPTHGGYKYNNSEHIVDINILKTLGNVVHIGHPSKDKKNTNLLKNLSEADIVISDYSSVGYDAIVLNIPTILIDIEHWDSHKSSLICEKARNATIRVKNMNQLVNAIHMYKKDPTFLEKERIHYGKLLSKYIGNASEVFVNELLKIVK